MAMNLSRPSYRQNGFNLVELMIAITIGLFITAAVAGIFIGGNRNYAEDDRFARMQENGRYALNVLAEDLSMAGYWGGAYTLSQITSAFATATCGTTLTVDNPITTVNSASAIPTGYVGCIPHAAGAFRTGTGILAIKRVLGKSETAPETGKVYLRVGPSTANFFAYSGTAPGTGETDWRFVPRIYYISNDADPDTGNLIPTLRRKVLVLASISGDEHVADGIEDIHVEYGINTGTGTNITTQANYYTASPTAAELTNAVTARVYVLVRSRDADPAYENKKVYSLGTKSVSYSGAPDSYYRRLFSTTVTLRNPSYLNRVN